MATILPVGYDKSRTAGWTDAADFAARHPYGATAVRRGWADLPESLRRAIGRRLGAPVVDARSAGGGFTRAFAAVLTTSAGLAACVKAAPLDDPTSDWYAREAAITASPEQRAQSAAPAVQWDGSPVLAGRTARLALATLRFRRSSGRRSPDLPFRPTGAGGLSRVSRFGRPQPCW